mmetsp:Transcript_23155/g.36085  ORF Transcript_23155/g.36085 Transcript_23155/m.36085 type:complete len:587 (-) Transcript_23155:56-1816(-)|eukprot:CAMPEP_0201517622 /NCGR_PEP_ID=MMETSP0161_2-20130828/8685_1 /ASSEMBLY_ACC=CAM_ASM_000251 /TAXON_ID=180227 /ORGANISM="Neoparamoeba aestuarina, Strain SoJaBio B1-5/56/2" /LENGTH=586 /DNA_ID=CAMNT_0047915175 /DNA_START=123 /DNA_END=1883 /DNA_ORIENTATION=+
MAGYVYVLMRWLCRFVLGIFFQEVEVVGSEHVPRTGPVIFTGNHQNQFVDGIMLLSYTNRHLGFLIAKKSFDKPIIGHFAKLIGAIPVVRKEDMAVVGTGKISFEMRGDTCYVVGEGTNFTKELGARTTLAIKGFEGQSVVKSVESDTLAVVNKMISVPEPQNFKSMPHLDQNEVFTTVYDTLRDQNCIAIFPEGGSHDRTTLLPLKAGVAIMALGALERDNVNTTIIPCGLTYFSGHRFRSRVMLEFGPPLVVTPDMLEKYRADKRGTSGQLLARVEAGLKEVTVNVPDYETLRCLRTARHLYQPLDLVLPADQFLQLRRRLAYGYNKWKEEPQVVSVFGDIQAYHQRLDEQGVKDAQIQTLDLSNGLPFLELLKRLLQLIGLSILASPGALFFSPMLIYIRQRALYESRKAQKASSVKLEGKDVIASQKILLGIMSVPVTVVFYFTVVAYFFGVFYGLLFLISLPVLGYVSTKTSEQLVLLFAATKPLIFLFFSSDFRNNCRELIEERRLLQRKVRSLIETFGPRTWGADWKHSRVIKAEDLVGADNSETRPGHMLWPKRESFCHEDVGSNQAILQGLDDEMTL